MRRLFEAEIDQAQGCSREVRVTHHLAIQRAILQNAAIAALEYLLDIEAESAEPHLTTELLSPSDGTPVSILDTILPPIRGTGWASCAMGWYETPATTGSGTTEPLVRELTRWVNFRNERFGHGVVDEATWKTADEWFPRLSKKLTLVLDSLLPVVTDDGSLVLKCPRRDLTIRSLRLIAGAPFVLRRIKRKASTWRLSYQRLSLSDATEGNFELPESPLLSHIESGPSQYSARSVIISSSETWRPLVRLPARQTNFFHGRRNELKQLEQWYSDSESRVCLIYGEGGIGKTTLALEFLNTLLDSSTSSVNWKPEIIAFYSAKQTRWGARGLEYIRGVSPMISESARLLARAVENRLGKEWYDDDPKRTIDRASNLLNEVGVGRDKILLVLDNTETLSRNQTEEGGLDEIIRHLSKRLCRVILTSRRREKVEAAPIQVLPMSDSDGAELLARLAGVYAAQPLTMAGEATLRRYSRKLAGRPLLLDVFARQASSHGASLDGALQSVLQTAGADLGRFLFEDAWQRISAADREVFATIAKIPDPIDSQVIGWICAESGVAHEVWLEAFEETRFGHLHDYGTGYDLELMPDTRSFLATKYQQMSSNEKARLDRRISKVRRRQEQFLKAQEGEVDDRIEEAFRTAAAKAAKIAVLAGRLQDARLWFEEAVRIDARNAALWDRFAWFVMMKLRDFDEAERISREACRLDPKSSEALFTLGMVNARRGRIAEADRALMAAGKLGKASHLVALQRARARVAALRSSAADSERLLSEGLALVNEAESRRGTDYWHKHIDECKRVRSMLDDLQRQLIGPKEPVVEHRRSGGKTPNPPKKA